MPTTTIFMDSRAEVWAHFRSGAPLAALLMFPCAVCGQPTFARRGQDVRLVGLTGDVNVACSDCAPSGALTSWLTGGTP